MKYLTTITAASVLAVSGFANAETTLTQNEMDGVNAGGFAFADAVATAIGIVNSTFTATVTEVVATNIIFGQFGAIFVIDSDAFAASASDSDGKAVALANAEGETQGTLLADTSSNTWTATDTVGPFASSLGYADNESIAASNIVDLFAAAASNSGSSASLSNGI
jgi:hypothetical protein